MNETEALRSERAALLVGMMIGHISELLNYMNERDATIEMAHGILFDIHKIAIMQIQELYYKGDKSE